ncbi:methylmalonyl-CoA mutase family protein [Tsukamurella paurometabola]|uniref:methylmalonyl-CoA mutase n=1 Tax=Tsukamurella paurometabola (strain ATCC 8368 / DSM 20162 / CCUG 35730 / CIP 100753 / JCM 10117 / KCTC 9821 / NBRC 16120 / NCIMB 702349 / NCTC 13040) TaxID=521096 RepID=D5UPG0_TSUPD|nr:methylmalonyl-CoA mutase family protein [Tsukamurella paurometabola]ADG78716.1 Methylmalonyl-CoA mutase [Tsukamurella paurometabola DSM 20162]SUP32860.1 Methylmalonyl-CoA mutase small subunit [Tsukamurella paurometabola]
MADNPYDAWRASVGAVLAKSRGGTPPEDPIATLTTPTEDDGVLIAPLYSRRDERPEALLPGVYPYTRGGSPTPDVRLGWRVAEVFGPETDAADVLGALESGASALWLTRPDPGPLLEGVYPDMAPILVTAGSQARRAAEQVLAKLDAAAQSDQYRPDLVRVSLGAAPLTSAVVGRSDVSDDEAIELARIAVIRTEDVRALVVDGADLHNAGATCAQELGLAAAAGLDHVRALVAAGFDTASSLDQLTFRLAATDDQFLTLAKIRAWRTVWARVAECLGHPGAGNAPVHAVTSLAATTQRDPWVNMLRGTVAAFGAGVGGADYVTTLGYDAALPGGVEGYSAGFSRRIARNTQLLLLEESNLGRVADPGAGSWHVESLTDDVARAAWAELQAVERAGGFTAGVSDESIAGRIGEAAERRDAAVSRRARKITGVNEFPNLAEAPIAPSAATNGPVLRSYAAPFDALRTRSDSFLREHGVRPRIRMVTIGSVAAHNARSTFVTNLLASGGIEAVLDADEQRAGTATVDGSPGAQIVVLAGSDAGYAEEGETLARSLREQGYLVLLAGAPGTVGDGLIDFYLHAKIDAAAVLDDLLTRLGA